MPGTGTTVNAATNSITLTGLNHSSDYDVYVYTVCAGLNDTSINSNRARFTTPCDVATLPYFENFDNCADPGTTRSPLPNCWSYTMLSAGTYAGASYTPAVYYTTSTGYTSSGQYCLYLYGTALTVLPEIFRPFQDYRMLVYAIVLILVMIATNNERLRAFWKRIGHVFRKKGGEVNEQ